jgi:nitroreductase
MLKRAPAAIVVLTKVQECKGVPDPLFYFEACSAATENIFIAANGQGLSSVWLGLYPTKDRMDVVSQVLNVPEELTPFSVLPIGFADEELPAYDFFDDSIVHYNGY